MSTPPERRGNHSHHFIYYTIVAQVHAHPCGVHYVIPVFAFKTLEAPTMTMSYFCVWTQLLLNLVQTGLVDA